MIMNMAHAENFPKYPANFNLTRYGAFLYTAGCLHVTFQYLFDWNQNVLWKGLAKQHFLQTNDKVGKEFPGA